MENKLTAWQRVELARHKDRLKAQDYIHYLFDDVLELHGDRLYKDDHAIVGGIGYFHDMSVTIIAQSKGKTLEENMDRRVGMSNPE